jgi:hypothetical protein
MPAGRPPKEFNSKLFADLVSIGCEEDEICWMFRGEDGKVANKDTLSRWCKRTYGVNFHEYKKQNGLMRTKIEVRRNQLELSKTSAAMAIWLGKQYLGQKESFEAEVRAEDRVTVVVDV